MKKFLIDTFHFSIIGLTPILIILIIYLCLDPFKVIYNYDIFYEKNVNGYTGLNRGYVSTTNFVNNCKKLNPDYNSFILGNSRSIFYQVSDWKKHLSPKSNCYHFDAADEGLWALNKKIELIDNMGLEIKNTLLILDCQTLIQDTTQSGQLFSITPNLVKNSNLLTFHLVSFKAFLSLKFIYAYMDFKISGKVKPYMTEGYLLYDIPMSYDIITNELRHDFLEDLINKKQYYDLKRLSVFYERGLIQKYSPISIKENQKAILSNMQNILKKHNTKIKIVISPLYNQEKINEIDLSYLKNLFGAANVSDFSGINKFTNNYENYYENSHYRPHVAREIMNEIYGNE